MPFERRNVRTVVDAEMHVLLFARKGAYPSVYESSFIDH